MSVKKGQRRGRYRQRETPPVVGDVRPAVLSPSPEDLEWAESLIETSPLTNVAAKVGLAAAALTSHLALRDLRSGRQLTVDEGKAVSTTSYELRKALADLKLTDAVKEDEDEI